MTTPTAAATATIALIEALKRFCMVVSFFLRSTRRYLAPHISSAIHPRTIHQSPTPAEAGAMALADPIHKSARTCESAPMRKIERISVSPADRERLERLVRDRNTPQKVVWRARIVLLASDGRTAEGIAAAVGKSLLTVRRWRRRYVAAGVDGLLKDATRPARVKPLSPGVIERVVHMTLHEKPPNATHWSLRSMAKAAGISYSSVQRIWKAHGLKPHQVETLDRKSTRLN